MKQSDKYAEIRIRIKIIFQENRNCYGYRRIHGELKKIGITVSEKIVRRIMKRGTFNSTDKTYEKIQLI